MSLVRFYVPVFNEITFLTQCTGSMLLCYWWVCIYGVLFVASFDVVLFKYSRGPFNTICPIGTSSLAFVRATRTFTIVPAGCIRGERQFICLMTISSYFLLQRICFEECELSITTADFVLSFHVLQIMKSLSNKKRF